MYVCFTAGWGFGELATSFIYDKSDAIAHAEANMGIIRVECWEQDKESVIVWEREEILE